MFSGERILIVHFRVGRTDGVSLEIEAWKKILTNVGAQVRLLSGSFNVGADYEVLHLENQLDKEVFRLDIGAFDDAKTFSSEDEFKDAFGRVGKIIEEGFRKAIEDFKPTKIIISNIFSVGENIAAAPAILSVLDEKKITTLLVHHDFWWENVRYREPNYPFVKDLLERNFPPVRSYLYHTCINSLARKELRLRKKINAEILYDSVDFDYVPQDRHAACAQMLRNYGIESDDLVILQATRVVRRKNIELAIDFVKELSGKKRLLKLKERGLYNGRGFDPKHNKVVLIIAGYAEKRDYQYLDDILEYAKKVGISFVHLNGAFLGYSKDETKGKAGLLDLYVYADLITYPSSYEGFGNQLLEGVLSKTPVVSFEYPVFISDIKPKGIEIISLGSKLITDPDTGFSKCPRPVLLTAVDEAVEILTSPKKYQAMVKKNFVIGKHYFSFGNTLEFFVKIFKPGRYDKFRKLLKNPSFPDLQLDKIYPLNLLFRT